MDCVRESYQRSIPGRRKHSIIDRTQTRAADLNEVKALNRLDGIRAERVEKTKPMKDLLTVGLNAFDAKMSGRAVLPLNNAYRHAALGEG
jgi:hypothetical protein